MPSGQRGRRCLTCPAVFITRSPTRWACDACLAEEKALVQRTKAARQQDREAKRKEASNDPRS